jgi:hypothetical protein
MRRRVRQAVNDNARPDHLEIYLGARRLTWEDDGAIAAIAG